VFLGSKFEFFVAVTLVQSEMNVYTYTMAHVKQNWFGSKVFELL
jgi:hypothetical protein